MFVMDLSSCPSLETVLQAIQILYNSDDIGLNAKENASKWLSEFEKSVSRQTNLCVFK